MFCSLQKSLQVSVCKEAAEREVAGRAFGRQVAVVGHFGDMVAADWNIKPEFAVNAHQGELVGVALVVEELGEVLLRPLHVADMDERYPLAKVASDVGECF